MKKIFFSPNFFLLNALFRIGLPQKLFESVKMFVLRLFKMATNQCSKLDQKSCLFVFFMAEKCKPYEIYKRMCDVYREACFSKKKNVQKMGLP